MERARARLSAHRWPHDLITLLARLREGGGAAYLVGGTVRDMMGLNAYMERSALNAALGDGDLGAGYVLAIERGRETAVLDATRALPVVAGAFSKATMVRNMEEISARNVRIMSTILTVFASVIAVGVVYNNARIVLAERGWELASLRVLGFTRAEVSAPWRFRAKLASPYEKAAWLDPGVLDIGVSKLARKVLSAASAPDGGSARRSR